MQDKLSTFTWLWKSAFMLLRFAAMSVQQKRLVSQATKCCTFFALVSKLEVCVGFLITVTCEGSIKRTAFFNCRNKNYTRNMTNCCSNSHAHHQATLFLGFLDFEFWLKIFFTNNSPEDLTRTTLFTYAIWLHSDFQLQKCEIAHEAVFQEGMAKSMTWSTGMCLSLF